MTAHEGDDSEVLRARCDAVAVSQLSADGETLLTKRPRGCEIGQITGDIPQSVQRVRDSTLIAQFARHRQRLLRQRPRGMQIAALVSNHCKIAKHAGRDGPIP